MKEKEERSEHIWMWVSPSVKKELESARDNQSLQEKIIKEFVTSEISFMKDEIANISEIDIRYKSMLITIKDNFEKSFESYCEGIQSLQNILGDKNKELHNSLMPVKNELETLKGEAEKIKTMVLSIKETINNLNIDKVYDIIALIERINKMSESEKEILSLLLKK